LSKLAFPTTINSSLALVMATLNLTVSSCTIQQQSIAHRLGSL
jgi:hypothetical protein